MLVLIFFILPISLCSADSPSSIIRPCRLTDYSCLQNNFAANSNCSRLVVGYIPDEFVVKQFRFEIPYYNSTFIEDDLVVKNNHRCFLTDFFFNTATNTALISVDCPGLILLAKRTLFLHQTQQEDKVYQHYVEVSYPLVRITMNLRNAGALDICSAFTFGDIPTLPYYSITPLDAASASYMPPDASRVPVYERENWLGRARPLMRFIINSLICDFGCE